MSTKRSMFHSFLLVFVFTLSLLGPAGATLVTSSKSAKAPSLLQFTSGGHVLGFTPQAMYASTGSHALHVDFLGAQAIQPQADSSAASFGRVSYLGLWSGIDLVYTAAAGGIYTTTYTLAPGADASTIRLRYNAPLALNTDGTLRIAFQTGTLTESAPIAWQEINGKRTTVDVSFQVRGQEVSFALGAYNPHHALTIDPTLAWNTFLGSGTNVVGTAIAIDGSGNIYVSGYSDSTWGSPVRAFTGSNDAFVAKLDSSTGSLVWNTFLGGSGTDFGNAIAVDGSGNVYVAGDSTGTWGSPVQAYTASGFDAFAAKLNASGSLTWNTFLGGSGEDRGASIAVDGSGNVYMGGLSFATWGIPVRAYTAADDAFAAKLNSSGSLTWSTFLGTTGSDQGYAIAIDDSGIFPVVLVTGSSDGAWSCSPTACTVRAYTYGTDAFVAKLNSSGSLTWNTFLGGSGNNDGGASIAVDGSGNVYVVGISDISWGSPVRAFTGNFDTFAAKLDSSGSLTWNTFLGENGADYGNSITVDGSANVYVAGASNATWGAPVRPYTAGYDDFAAGLDSSGGLTWNTFLGGSGNNDGGASIAVDGSRSVYMVGISSATWGSPVEPYTPGVDAFVAKLGPPTVVSSTLVNLNPTNRAHVNFTVTFSEAVTGVDTADFSLTTSGVAGASVTSVSGSGATRTVSVNTGSGNGTLRLNVSDNDTIMGAASTPLGGVGAGNGNFTAGQTYTVNKTITLSSIGSQDGLVLESSETSNVGGTLNSTAATFNLGDDVARKQYCGILSFSTGSIPDTAVITGVTLKVKKSSVVGGGNPVTTFQGFMADIKTGFFGTAALQAADFQAAASKTIGPTSPTLTSGLYTINLVNAKTFINKLSTNGGVTQIRLRFKLDDNNNTTANFLSLFSGNAAAADRPQLVITYYVP